MIDPFTPRYDAIVIGSGAGGSTLAYELSRRGHRVLVVERGNFLKPQRLNPSDPIGKYIYRMIRNLDDSYFVGGHTKFYGSALYRMRESDFHAVEHEKGVSPAWPITYSELEPYYEKAEVLYRVHGATLGDPTEPPRARPFPYPPIEHAPLVSGLVRRIEQSGTRYRRFHSAWITGRAALVFSVRPVMDTIARLTRRWMAEIAALRPALATRNVRLLTEAECLRVLTTRDGSHVTGVLLRYLGREQIAHANVVAVCAGLVDSASLLRRSRTRQASRRA